MGALAELAIEGNAFQPRLHAVPPAVESAAQLTCLGVSLDAEAPQMRAQWPHVQASPEGGSSSGHTGWRLLSCTPSPTFLHHEAWLLPCRPASPT